MSYKDNVKRSITNTIRKRGNNGKVLHIKELATLGIPRNSYDEEGNEITLGAGETENSTMIETEFKYVSKQLRGQELARFAPNSQYYRFTCLSMDFLEEDYLKNNVIKGDEFIGFDDTKFSIEEVHHVGQTQNTEIQLEIICRRV